MGYLGNKRAQVTMFVIIAIVLVGGLGVFMYLRSSTSAVNSIPAELAPAFSYYEDCASQQVKMALDIAGSQGGYLERPKYSGPSVYAPFSSELNFVGMNVPYWNYVSGNGIVREQVPTKNEVERQISAFLKSELPKRCMFDDFYARGWQISTQSPEVSVTISDNSVQTEIRMPTTISSDNSSASKTDYSINVQSEFGSLLNAAQELYQKEASEAFLENYTLDVIHLYAPVDGVEIGCSPKIWKSRDVEAGIKQGLEANVQALQFGQSKGYFGIPVSLGGVDARAMYSRSWPSRLEIAGADGELMKTQPIGQQEGLGVLGFCYQPYHFVYSLMYPVLFQLTSGDELFQFPVVVRIKDNAIREGHNVTGLNETEEPDICSASTQDVEIRLASTDLKQVNGEVSYSCFDQSCSLGNTTRGVLDGRLPACINGFIDVNAAGYAPEHFIFSSHNTSSADIVMNRLYTTNISLIVSGKALDGRAIVSFDGPQATTIALPDVQTADLSEGFYNVSVYVYGNSSITVPATTSKQCTTVSSSGLLGFLGQTEEQCFDINFPETKIESALIGGGAGEVYLLPEMLSTGKITLSVTGQPAPKSLDDLQTNYALFETQGVDIIR